MNAPALSLDPASLRTRLQSTRAMLREHYLATRDLDALLKDWSHAVDALLGDIWHGMNFPDSVALLAVGGYGRGEVFPYSDIDILVLLPDTCPASVAQKVEKLIGLFWDIGLDVGHGVRTQQECLDEASKDITVQTTLLEARPLVCVPERFDALHAALAVALDPKTFLEAKLLEQQQRHARYHGVAYNLEPNVKESPGGLRDLQTVLWIAQGCGLGNSWEALVSNHIMSAAEARQIRRAEKVLKSLRVGLHYLANRREDRLLFDLQNQLAREAGFEDTKTRRASEQLMQTYYRAARTIIQLNDILIQNLRGHIFSVLAEVTVINDRFFARNNLLLVRDLHSFEHTPSTILEAFLLLAKFPNLKGLGAKSLRALWLARSKINHEFRRDPRNREMFMEILRQPQGITRVLRRMNQYGVLGRYIPAFGRVVGQMQHDLFHVYTVDEHILMVVRNLRRFAVPEFTHEYPFCSRLIADFERPEVLYLAGLFHDIGKGRGGDHSQLGKVDALRFAKSHGLSPEDTEMVGWLVEQHLVMSAVAQKQDVYDPEVVESFAKLVGTQRCLAALYLLTVADIRGTSPKVWNNWKAKLLEDLYHATSKHLANGHYSLLTYLEERQAEAVVQLQYLGLTAEAHLPLWQQLDTVYFMRHDAKEIAWHTRLLYNKVDTVQPVVRARLSETGEGLQVLVYVPDQPDLFARICSFFERARFSIADAKIYTTRHGYALDSFYVFLPENDDQEYRDLIAFTEFELSKRLTDRAPLEAPLTGRLSRHLKHFPLQPEVNIRMDDKQNYYVMSIVAGDRPGLLSRLTRVLSSYQVNIHNARISTLGERAEDTFLLTGEALKDAKTLLRLEADLMQAAST